MPPAASANLDTGSVLTLLMERPDVMTHAYVVGAWVWVEFPDRPDSDTRAFLKATGFHWNQTRKVWQHPCGVHRHHTSGDPRFTYGVTPLGGTTDESTD